MSPVPANQTTKSGFSRRGFLQVGASVTGGFLLGFSLPAGSRLSAQTAAPAIPDARLNAWIHIAPDDQITFMIHKSEMGQGTVTSLSQLLADELECDWGKFRTEFPPVDRAFGPMQGVVGSQSIRTSWIPLRRAGATAREMLIQAAAQTWGVDKSQCRAQSGVVINTATKASLSYGKLAGAAAKLPVPANVALKDPSQYRYIGKSLKRLDTAGKVNGSTQFGIDARLPGLVYAAVARCPVVGGKVVSFDDKRARAFPGVKQIVPISSGVAVVANNTWSAIQASRLLDIKWDEGPNAAVNTPAITKMFADKTLTPGTLCKKVGDVDAGLKSAAQKVEAVYQAPFLAHAPMEPLNCTADVRPNECHIWASTQMQTVVLGTAVQLTGLKPEQIHVHSMYMGGGFGRRATGDFISDAVEISKAIGVPVKATWSREDDIQHDRYRPAALARFSAGLDTDGWPVAWMNRFACPSIQKSSSGQDPRNGLDSTSTEGLDDLEYDIPNFQAEYHWTETGIPVHYWRAVGFTQNTFFAESFLDELAAAGKKDPVELRRRLLAKSPRLLHVLELAAEKSGWGQPLPTGHSHGVAAVFNVGTYSAQVAEISISSGKVRVHRVVAAVDCGHVVNPAIVQQQIRSAIVYGLTAALKGEITLDKGRVQQTNFHQYDMLRIDEMPVVDVYIVPSTESPGGIGEAGVPAIAPAVCNAVFAATGKRIRQLPIRPDQLA
jgi:isoquinoline 1-oxidoreductase beta subunit